MKELVLKAHAATRLTVGLDFLPPLFMRILLAHVFMAAGLTKAMHFDFFVVYFSQLGVPMPPYAVSLVLLCELMGAVALLLGLAVRWFVIPLMFIMIVAIALVHWDNGWSTIAPTHPDTHPARWLVPLGVPGAQESLARSQQTHQQLSEAVSILKRHGDVKIQDTAERLVVLNNGIESATLYLIMLLTLFFTGSGRFFSFDYWLARLWLKLP